MGLNFTGIQNRIQRIFQPIFSHRDTTLPPGLYHYVSNREDEKSRVHLRVDQDGSGVLLVNANRVFHLNPTAANMAYMSLEKLDQKEVFRRLKKVYGTSARTIEEDYIYFSDLLTEILRPNGACPIHELDFEITPPFQTQPSAPYRMDLAITYRCNNDCAHCYNARSRDFAELDTSEWFRILDKLWQIGIPHVVFTGGEPTLRSDLLQLIAHAEKNGQITGINTNGRRLADMQYVNRLIEAGLDHIQITLESFDPLTHDRMVKSHGAFKQTIRGIQNVARTPLYLMTNTTLLKDNAPQLEQTLDFLSELGVPTVGLNALIYSGQGLDVGTGLNEFDLNPLLHLAREKTEFYNQRLIWYTPTQYCHFDPVQLDLGVKGCSAALYAMCIEANGDVLPCQSYYHPLGNIRSDPWDHIWNHSLAVQLRNRDHAREDCQDCLFFQECGGGCPLHQNAVKPKTIPFIGENV